MRQLGSILVLILAIVVSACQNPPVYNVDSAPLNPPAGATLKDVEKAILNAGTKRGWTMKVVKPGHIVASHSRGPHAATVDVWFDTTAYSITYKDSVELDYDGTTIHGTYNRWVEYLKQDIALYVQTI